MYEPMTLGENFTITAEGAAPGLMVTGPPETGGALVMENRGELTATRVRETGVAQVL